MKKTMSKAIAAILAVLMVITAMPFTVLASDKVTIKAGMKGQLTDEYIDSYNDFVGYEEDAYFHGDGITLLEDKTGEYTYLEQSLHSNYKPALHVIVSDYNTTAANAANYKFYGKDKSVTYNELEAEGKILDPTDIKAGTIFCLTVELSGMDTFFSSQLAFNYPLDTLQAGSFGRRSWDVATNTTAAVRSEGSSFKDNYGVSAFTNEGTLVNQTTGRVYMPILSLNNPSSVYLTKNAAKEVGYGTFGVTYATISLKALQDCNLMECLKWDAVATFAQAYQDDDYEQGDPTNFADRMQNVDIIFENAGEDEPDVPHTHDYQLTSTTDATCTTDKVEHYTCTNADGKCDALTSDKTIENTKLGHNFNGDLTSLNNGKHTVKCTRCDETKTVDCTYTSETIGADCTKPGTIKYTCECGYYYTESTGSALGHDFVKGTVISDTVTKKATCEADGERTIVTKCVRCDETETTTATITKTGHAWDDGVVTTVATCQTEGVKTYTCANDTDHTKTESIGKDKNNHVGPTTIVGAEAATCAKDGYTGDEVCACGEIVKAGTVISKDTVAHTPMAAAMENEVAADYDNEGSYDMVVRCEVCNAVISSEHFTTPVLEGIKVTVTPSALGTATVKGLAVEDEAVTANCAPNSDVVLTATPVEGAVFVGWNVDGKLVSTAANVTVKALADITYVPVFQNAAEKFTVVFADRYGNIFATQEVTSGAEINLDAVKAPAIAGYTFVGWSVEDVTTITGATTIQAVYEKNETAGYKVTATGCSITAGAETVADVLEGVEYDTLVTVTAEGAKAWTINGATVAYGESYTFYVGSDVTVVPVFDDVTTVKPQVAAVDVSKVVVDGKTKASFLATRTMTADCTYVNAGFVYGKNLANNDITLADVKAGSAVKAYYCATNAEQFALTVGSADGKGVLTARAFLAYVDANGATQVVYAEPQTFDYATMA